MAHFVMFAAGKDRPGIVASVTSVLVDQGCNLEDTSMSILRGYFAMMLVVAGPDGLDARRLEGAMAGPVRDFDLAVSVRSIEHQVASEQQGETWTVSVYGADRPGIVHRVASLLAAYGVNIIDLDTRLIGEADSPVYAMIMEVSLPAGLSGEGLSARLQEVAGELAVECSAHPSGSDVF